MESLATPLTDIKAHYDAVVVGSGYGAGIAASRLARCGLSVCVLERGREILPGGFPKTFREANREFQADLPFTHLGAETALFDLRVNRDMNVMVGCGLGGTSLINGNVMLEPDPQVFADPCWPGALRAERETLLAEGYRRAAAMLGATPYPDSEPLAKLDAFEAAAAHLGAPCTRPPINVTFDAMDGGNLAGVVQPPCTLCGDCCSGCNVGAKNTVAMNYLPDAVNHGARLFTEALVSHVTLSGGRWQVHYRENGEQGGAKTAPSLFVTGGIVVLGAGTLGSTEILLRSREAGLALSDRLGENFSGNGDVLAFGYNNDRPINGIGIGHPPRKGLPPVGPVIAGLIDLRGGKRLEDGLVIQEGALPSPLAPLLPSLLAGGSLLGSDTDEGDEDQERGRSLESLTRGAYRGAAHNTQTFLVMAQDGGGGQMKLEKDRLRIHWPGVGKRPVFRMISDTLKKATEATGGTFIDNPLWAKWLGRNLVSVHPLGGCGMGEEAASGVIDHKCRVFAGSEGTAVHEGLYVCDGSVMPRGLGVNPSLTISALTERAMMHLAADRGLSFGVAPKAGAPKRFAAAAGAMQAAAPTLSYSERLRGEVALLSGPAEAAELSLTAVIEDLEAFIRNPKEQARLYGAASISALSEDPFVATDGAFNIYAPDASRPEARCIDYKAKLTSGAGQVYFLCGTKDLTDDPGFDLLSDLRTLEVRIHDGDSEDAALCAQGRLKVRKRDLLRQLRSIEIENVTGKREKAKLLARFGKLLAGDRFEEAGRD